MDLGRKREDLVFLSLGVRVEGRTEILVCSPVPPGLLSLQAVALGLALRRTMLYS